MSDNVKHPKHYSGGREYEPWDVIADWGLDFDLGNVVKYISRAGRKGSEAEDLLKAEQYLKHAIELRAQQWKIDGPGTNAPGWLKEDRGGVEYTAVCSECGYGTFWSEAETYNFCPMCGSDMRGDKNE